MRVIELTHEVKDYTTWKTAFDAHKNVREEYGLTEVEVLTSPDNRNLVTIVFEEEKPNGYENFMNHSNVREIMESAGVISEPKIKYFYKDLV